MMPIFNTIRQATVLLLLVLYLIGPLSSAQQFEDGKSDLAYPALSKQCLSALNTTVECPAMLGVIAFNDIMLSSEQLEALCTNDCYISLSELRAKIKKMCKLGTDVLEDQGVVYPSTFYADTFMWTFNRSCLRDAATKEFCDTILQSGLDGDKEQNENACSDCALKMMAIEINSPFGYSNESLQDFEALKSSCSASGYPVEAPTPYTISQTALPTATEEPAPTQSCPSPYIIKDEDTCESIALTQNVSTFRLTQLNNIDVYCAGIPASGASICLPEPCEVYKVQENQTCSDVVKEQPKKMTITQLRAWNPNINKMCGNHGRMNGTIICVSPLGGFLSIGSGSNGTAGSAQSPVAAPSNVDSMTSPRCGRYYTVKAGDFCSTVTMKFGIALKDFYFLNPRLDAANCTNLEKGKAYCVQPVGVVTTYANYTPGATGDPCFGPAAPSSCFSDVASLPDVPNIAGNVTIPGASSISSTQFSTTTASRSTAATSKTSESTPLGTSEIPSTSDRASSTSSTSTSSTSNSSASPTQTDGIVEDCVKYYTVQDGDSCETIAKEFELSSSQFQEWNPSVGKECKNIWTGYQYCIAIRNMEEPSSTSAVATSTSGSVAQTQKQGISDDCTDYHTVEKGDTCDSICDSADITFEQLREWNPSIGEECEKLLTGFQYCIAAS